MLNAEQVEARAERRRGDASVAAYLMSAEEGERASDDA